MNTREYIELLAPAKNLEYGKAAFDYGADAIYIGGPSFGARANAGNSMSDIGELVRYAHRFDGEVFMAINTILYDHELEEARRIIWDAYDAGVDALIVQDMGILEMDLPPISLHASTQTNNFSLEKVQFLENVGFDRVVLARELTIEEINHIAKNTKVELEAFIHGALCVSLSGQCYMSAFNGTRSANRGACVQSCRKTYSLFDAEGKQWIDNKYLLSLKDINQTPSIEQMVHSGVQSLKIEGRLKDITYLKNSVGHYRKEIDAILDGDSNLKRSSAGKTIFDFTPDPKKSFSRDFTPYFLQGKQESIANLETPKSMGEYIGEITHIGKKHLEIENSDLLANNDGLVAVTDKKETEGFKVNTVENGKVFPQRMPKLHKGSKVYRNYNHLFLQTLDKSRTTRKRAIDAIVSEEDSSISIQLSVPNTDISVVHSFNETFDEAQNIERSKENIQKQLSKLGDSPFYIGQFEFQITSTPFIPNKLLTQTRRELVMELIEKLEARIKEAEKITPNEVPYIEETIDYRGNVANKLAVQFYQRHQTKVTEMAFELSKKESPSVLMHTRYCILNELGMCLKKGNKIPQPLMLKDEHHEYRLEFDCKNCFMKIWNTER